MFCTKFYSFNKDYGCTDKLCHELAPETIVVYTNELWKDVLHQLHWQRTILMWELGTEKPLDPTNLQIKNTVRGFAQGKFCSCWYMDYGAGGKKVQKLQHEEPK